MLQLIFPIAFMSGGPYFRKKGFLIFNETFFLKLTPFTRYLCPAGQAECGDQSVRCCTVPDSVAIHIMVPGSRRRSQPGLPAIQTTHRRYPISRLR
jgi:hypothetical protein